jgi:hypothetical protein
MLKTKDEIEAWLDKMQITNYKINDDLSVNVHGDVMLHNRYFNKIPVQFGIINGDFIIDYNCLTSLKGGPTIVTGNFDCSHNRLESLEYCPKEVGGIFVFRGNKLSTLDHLPQSVGVFAVYDSEFKNLTGFKTQVTNYFIHKCKFLSDCISKFEQIYNYDIRNSSQYTLKLSTQQINSIQLEEQLTLEMPQNTKVEKKLKV